MCYLPVDYLIDGTQLQFQNIGQLHNQDPPYDGQFVAISIDQKIGEDKLEVPEDTRLADQQDRLATDAAATLAAPIDQMALVQQRPDALAQQHLQAEREGLARRLGASEREAADMTAAQPGVRMEPPRRQIGMRWGGTPWDTPEELARKEAQRVRKRKMSRDHNAEDLKTHYRHLHALLTRYLIVLPTHDQAYRGTYDLPTYHPQYDWDNHVWRIIEDDLAAYHRE